MVRLRQGCGGQSGRKRFGQHFLERPWVDKIVAAVAPQPGEVFLEIGPGRGQLTDAARARRRHRPRRRDRPRSRRRAATRRGAAARRTSTRATSSRCRPRRGSTATGPTASRPTCPTTSRRPSSAACSRSPARGACRDAVLMLQKEVADRLVARPGSGDYGPLAIAMALQADVSRVFVLPPGAFRPPPEGPLRRRPHRRSAPTGSPSPTCARFDVARPARLHPAPQDARHAPCRRWPRARAPTPRHGWPRPASTAASAPRP